MVSGAYGEDPATDCRKRQKCTSFIEVLDARVPVSSRNPVLPELTGGKPVLLLLNKGIPCRSGQEPSSCVPTPTRTACLLCDCVTG